MNSEQISMQLAGLIAHPAQNRQQITETIGTANWCVYKFSVAGVSFRQAELEGFSNGNWATIKVEIDREPTNPHDPNAIAVSFTDRTNPKKTQIGYVPRELVSIMTPAALSQRAWCRLESIGHAKGNKQGKTNLGAIIYTLLAYDPAAEPALASHQGDLIEFAR